MNTCVVNGFVKSYPITKNLHECYKTLQLSHCENCCTMHFFIGGLKSCRLVQYPTSKQISHCQNCCTVHFFIGLKYCRLVQYPSSKMSCLPAKPFTKEVISSRLLFVSTHSFSAYNEMSFRKNGKWVWETRASVYVQ